MKITFKVQKLFCACCERKFDDVGLEVEKSAEINFKHMMGYLDISGNNVYKEDLSTYVSNYLSDELEDYLERGEVTRLSDSEERRVETAFEEYLKTQNIEVIH